MIKKIKQWFRSSSPSLVIEKVLRRELSWYDYEKLTNQEQISYYNKIRSVLLNDAFQNEIKHFLTDLIEEVAKSDNEPKRDKILRYSINGIETLLERLEAIHDPKIHEPTRNNVNEDI